MDFFYGRKLLFYLFEKYNIFKMKINIFFVIIACSLFFIFSHAVYSQEEGSYKTVYSSESKDIIKTEKNIIILDVRSQSEYNSGHIQGAVSIPYTDINEKAGQIIPDKQTKILVYCQNGSRSIIAAKKLVKLGYCDVYNCGAITNLE